MYNGTNNGCRCATKTLLSFTQPLDFLKASKLSLALISIQIKATRGNSIDCGNQKSQHSLNIHAITVIALLRSVCNGKAAVMIPPCPREIVPGEDSVPV